MANIVLGIGCAHEFRLDASTEQLEADRRVVEAPNDFSAGRPWDQYILWGYGQHTCFGQYINRAVIPALLKPLLRQTGLRRTAGDAGRRSLPVSRVGH